MNNIARLIMNAFEQLKEGDTEEAVHGLRALADEIEVSGCPDVEDLYTVASNLVHLMEEE